MLKRKPFPSFPHLLCLRTYLLTFSIFSVPRRPSAGAQHAGRGGAGNFFKAHDADNTEMTRTLSNENAIDDTPIADDSLAAKGKSWLLGKKA